MVSVRCLVTVVTLEYLVVDVVAIECLVAVECSVAIGCLVTGDT